MRRPVQLQLAGPTLNNLKRSCSPRHKAALWKSPPRKSSGLTYPFFPLSFLFPLTFLFPLPISRPPPGVCQNKNSPSHFTRHLQPQTRKIESLPLSPLRPNRRHRMDRATSRTRQSPMPPSLISASNFFLRLSHPVRNNEDTYQLLDRNAPTLGHLLQLQENTMIKNLHELH